MSTRGKGLVTAVWSFALAPFVLAQPPSQSASADPGCPGYPAAVRADWEEALATDNDFRAYQKARRAPLKTTSLPTRRDSFIDHLLFDKMQADGVRPANVASDAEFLRRVYLDLTGRIPQPAEASAFFANPDENKRAALVRQLVASRAFTDQFTTYFSSRFEVTRGTSNVGLSGRNAFYAFVRDFVERDRSYASFVSEMLSATGDADTVPGTQFFTRNIAEDGPIQDTWDNTTDVITTQFLGFRTLCISCHNGRGYLDRINLYLTRRTRQDFWQQSAFLSRTHFLRWSDDTIGFRPRTFVIERDYGNYAGATNTPGARPPRSNQNLDPMWILSGEEVKNHSGSYREVMARMLVNDRQFARAAVNYLWAYFFNSGIVDPPDAWDLLRTDPSRPVPAGWPFQNANPELLERLTDHFIANNYSIREMARLITSSTAYQLSAQYEGEWRPGFARYFARRNPRRLTAEELYDSIVTATRTEAPMSVLGWDRPVTYANQLPDPTEPATDGGVQNLLTQFGRGNWLTVDTNNGPTLLGLLYSMNDAFVVNRTLGFTRASVTPSNRVLQIHAQAANDEEAIRQMYLATLTRLPSDQEMAQVLAFRTSTRDTREQWLSDLQWALLNKLDFIFNY